MKDKNQHRKTVQEMEAPVVNLSVDYAQNLVVLKTMPGLAGAAGAAFDGMEITQMVGTIAGDDTVLVIMRDAESALEFIDEIREMQKKTQK